ncbi:CE1 family esterase [Halovulum sp. GXIMD14793]
MRLFSILAVMLWMSGAAQADAPCLEQDPCALGDRSYHVKLPDDWDGVSPMPVMLHFHGWGRQGTLIVKHSRISGATRRAGVLLLAPNGLGKSWNFWNGGAQDVAFAEEVLADAAKRWPIDRGRIYVSGYSYGAAMAWRFACQSRVPVAALLAVSGTLRQDEDCAGPVEVRHVHGLRDTVMDFPIGPGGDVTYPVALWRRENGCLGQPDQIADWQVTERDVFTRHVWQRCSSGREVRLDVHKRGHFIPRGWLKRQLEELLAAGG